ncbi:MAG: type II secretion system GspH family protein [[Eubacterium] saphenum]|nr:type II secretion system GspH family protein [[Eubacterium] saphenum]
MKKIARLKAKSAFTLVELVVVIAIIGVLAGILIPVLVGNLRNARVTSANSTANDVRNAVNMWLTQMSAKNIYTQSYDDESTVYVKIVANNGVYEDPEFVGDFWVHDEDEDALSQDLKQYIEKTLGYKRMYSIGYLIDGRIGALYFVEDGAEPQDAPTAADFKRTDFWPVDNGYTRNGDVIGTSPILING